MKIVLPLFLLGCLAAPRGQYFYRVKLAIDGRKTALDGELSQDLALHAMRRLNKDTSGKSRYPEDAVYTTVLTSSPQQGPKTVIGKTRRRLFGAFSEAVNYDFKPSAGVDWVVSPPPMDLHPNTHASYVLEFRSSMPSCLFTVDSATLHDTKDIYIRNLVRCDSGKVRISPVPSQLIKQGAFSGEPTYFSDIAPETQFLY